MYCNGFSMNEMSLGVLILNNDTGFVTVGIDGGYYTLFLFTFYIIPGDTWGLISLFHIYTFALLFMVGFCNYI